MDYQELVEEMNNEKKALELQRVVKEFFDTYLNYVEESDSGKRFNPVTISCCRAIMFDPLDELIYKMQVLSGAKPNPLHEEET